MTEDDPGAGVASDGDERITAFWQAARARVGFGKLETVLGGGPLDVVPPPSFAFGDTPELSDELLDLVLRGRKTATSTAMAEFERAGETGPKVGDVSIVLDGAGEPRALIRTTRADVVAFGEVDAEYAAAEGEGDLSLESWRADHERYWRRVLGDDVFSLDMPILAERFELVYPVEGASPPVD